MRFLYWIILLPFQFLLLAVFSLFDVLHLLRLAAGGSSYTDTHNRQINQRDCSIVVLNWNGCHLLEESLPALVHATHSCPGEHEIIVVDNGSADGSVDWLRKTWPQVKVVPLADNLGFGEGNNRGVEAARHDIVVLLNNDMVVEEDFLPPLLEGFSDPEVFAISSQIFFPAGKQREETGNTRIRFKWGYPHLAHEPIRQYHYTRKYLPVLWAGGGSSAFHRRRFRQLGGFSPLFSPCYFEDTDLSYRAWRRGWKVLLAAQSKVMHKHQSSSRVRFNREALDRLKGERKLWYVWRNYSLRTVGTHLLFLPLYVGRHLSALSYWRALTKLPAVLGARLREPRRRIAERTLLTWFRRPLSYLHHMSGGPSPTSQLPLRILIASAYLPGLGQHGGAGRVFHLLNQVSKKHAVALVTFVESDQEAAAKERIDPHCKRIETVLRRRFAPVSPFPYEPFEEFNSPEFREKLEELLTEKDFDLVHFEWPQMAQYADLVPHIPKLLTEVEVNYAAHYSLVPLESNPLRRMKKLYNSLQTFYRELEMCRRVEKVICVTGDDREYLRGYIEEEKLAVINTGVDAQYFSGDGHPAVDPDALVYVGAFRHEPNVEAMLYFYNEVFPLILKERPQTHLYVVGSSPPLAIQKLHLHPQVTVTGYVEDIRDFYRKAQVVVVPLRTGVGIRGKILEGWAMGKAMVATPLACLGISAVHGENIIVAKQANEFALWTLALLRNPDFCRRLGKAGRQTARQCYDWSLLGNQMIDLYESVAKSPTLRNAPCSKE